MSFRRAPARSRRVDDALSQLVESLLPPLSLSAVEGDYSADEEDALVAAEERRHRDRLDGAWRLLESSENAGNASVAAENINNASDLIKRKLLGENASPDKAVRFSNLYSRLLTQPVLGQKWAILYLLYKLSGPDGDDELSGNGGRSRSPLMEDGHLENMLFSGLRSTRTGTRMADDVDEGPAISSSVSQRGERPERRQSLRAAAAENQRHQAEREEGKESRPGRSRTISTAQETVIPDAIPSSPPVEVNPKITKSSESSLLRDLPFILQGLSSTNVEFSSSSVIKLPSNLPIPMISLLHTLAEPCLLYRGLSAFIDGSEGGLISQALRAAMGNELRSYLSLVATLEGEIRRALTAAAEETDPKGAIKGAVTLKRCVVWTRDATMALRLMSVMVEEARCKPLISTPVLLFAHSLTDFDQIKRVDS